MPNVFLNRLLFLASLTACAWLCKPTILLADGPDSPDAERLTQTSWQLERIQWMDDREAVPGEPANFTLDLIDDGTFSVHADCNRGTGSWELPDPGQIRFNGVAATQALCGPDSLSEDFLSQFAWVRSYVIENGNLFLATMADGSIIKLTPTEAGVPTAVLFGAPITTGDPAEVQQIIVSGLLDDYAERNDIEATEEEMNQYVANMEAGMRREGLDGMDSLTDEEVEQVQRMRREMGHSMIRQWKINRSLYDRYGGRIIYQQFGPEPLDAYRQYFEQQQSSGAFSFNDPEAEKQFWSYFLDEERHDFMDPDGEDAARAFSIPPWE